MNTEPLKVLSREEEVVNGNLTGRLIIHVGREGESGDRYVIGAHPGDEAIELGYTVNKLIAPRQLELTELHDKAKMDADTLAEIKKLRETDPDAADKRMADLTADMDPLLITRAMGKAWRDVDPKQEKELVLWLLKYTSSPKGALSVSSNYKAWFQRDKLAHIKLLRDEVIEHNRFFDMMDGLL